MIKIESYKNKTEKPSRMFVCFGSFQLLDTCIENCNPRFRVDFFTSEPLIGEFESLEKKVKPAVALDMRTKLKKWAEKYPYPLIETLNEKLQVADAKSKARKHSFVSSFKCHKKQFILILI